MGAVHPGGHFLGGGKVKIIPKNLEREKSILRGRNFRRQVIKEL